MRIWHACSISILAHGALLALPAGHLVLTNSNQIARSQPVLHQPGRPAPMTVTLGPQTIRLVRVAELRAKHPAKGAAITESAPALDSVATEPPALADYRGNTEAFGLPVPAPLGVPAPEYLDSHDLSQRPEMVTDLPGLPDDPVTAPGSGILVITLLINELGQVDRIIVVMSQLDPETERAVTAQFKGMQFSPALQDHRPVKSRMKILVEVLPPGTTPAGISAGEN